MPRVVIVSNRVPAPGRGKLSAGGLAVVLADALQPGSLWFGWSGQRAAQPAPEATVHEVDGVTYATFDLREADFRPFYAGFGNSALWPVLSFRLGLIRFRHEDYEGYRAVNRAYAQALKPLLRPDDAIWIHDYLLIPLAHELRALGVTNRIGIFFHTPFPPSAVFSVLPRAAELLDALCACDVIGLQTDNDQRAFLDCAVQMLGAAPHASGAFVHRDRSVRAIAVPAGIDADGFIRMAQRAARSAETRRLGDSLSGRALAIGAERLDYSKGLPTRVEAFATLLSKYPLHRRAVSFLQVAAPSREDVSDYRQLRRELDRMVGETNGRYGEPDWTPLRYITRSLSRQTLSGFYRVARIGLVTPWRDGMNLVAKEYVAAQQPSDPGVLVLSRFAGAAADLTEALIVNPLDAEEIADAMHRALVMPLAERQERHAALLARVRQDTAARYCQRFLNELVPSSA